MPVHDDLGTRMKEYYENIPKTKLMRRTPVAIRIDGKAFHTFTRGFKRPFDEILVRSMQETTQYLCEHIQGCVLGYTQSDEITLILVDYKNLDSSAWFDYEVQKLCSISASMATMAFNQIFTGHIYTMMTHFHYMNPEDGWWDKEEVKKEYGLTDEDFELGSDFWDKRWTLYQEKMGSAMFDARAFNIPREEVTNLIYWRQLDATRNSIQMVGQANFSHRELQGCSCSVIQDMLHEQKGINWNDFPTHLKRGSCVIKKYTTTVERQVTEKEFGEPEVREIATRRSEWVIDKEIPIFKGEGRKYIEDLIQPEEE